MPYTVEQALEIFGGPAVLRKVFRAMPSVGMRREAMLALALAGCRKKEIASDLGYHHGYVGRAIKRAVADASPDIQALAMLHLRFDKPRESRLWDWVIPEPNSGCWLWVGNDNGRGYGIFQIHRKQTYVHRYVYEKLVGPIKDGLELDHLCSTRCCCNPDHLQPVTKQENIRRAVARRRRWQP